MTGRQRPRVLIIGAGFGGLFAARALAGEAVDVVLVDRNNYHTFTPLLYQVATCALDPSEIAYPVRSIFRRNNNVLFLTGEVTALDLEAREAVVVAGVRRHREAFDYLIVAAGSTPAYFGNDSFKRHAFELRTLVDAIQLRNHVLNQFEQATWTEDSEEEQALTTIVVVGGGPTGIETAGAVYELYNHVLDQEYRQKSLRARVVLIEMQAFLLASYPEKLRRAAVDQLRSLGVEVILNQQVTGVNADQVQLGDGTSIRTHTLIWAAGVRAPPLAEMLGIPLAKGGTVPVTPMLEVVGLERVYAVGDMAYLEDDRAQPHPMVIPVAQQQGVLAARNILASIKQTEPAPFRYHDRGIMATIGRSRAVAWLYNRIALRGRLAWLVWLGLHLVTLMGFRNRLNVLVNWIWNYLTYDRSVRIILEPETGIPSGDGEPASPLPNKKAEQVE